MRNYYFITAMVGLLFMGCSVDNDELNFNEDQIQTANLVISDVCMPSVFEIENSNQLIGNVNITNSTDGTMAYLNFNTEDGFYITEIRLAMADDLSGIPYNNGGIIPGHLKKFPFDSVSKAEFEYAVSGSFVVAALVTITDDDGKKYKSWIGDESQWRNSSSYLSYEVCIPQQEPTCEAYAGSPNSKTYTYSEIDALIDDVGAIEPFYKKNLLDEGVSLDGTITPTGAELLRSFNRNPYQEFKTTYTVTNEVNGVTCSDSVELTLIIIPD